MRAGHGSRVVLPASYSLLQLRARGWVILRAFNPRRLPLSSSERAGELSRVPSTRVVVAWTWTNFNFHLLLDHNASKHLQSLQRMLQYLIKTYEWKMDPKDAKLLFYMIIMYKMEA